MVNIASQLDKAMRAEGIPIDGVSIGKPNDKKTWSVQFSPDVTEEQKIDAQNIINTFVPSETSEAEKEVGLFIDSIEGKTMLLFHLVGRYGNNPPADVIEQARKDLVAAYVATSEIE